MSACLEFETRPRGAHRRQTPLAADAARSPRRTFRRQDLEADFLKFCQLSTQNPPLHLSGGDLVSLQAAAKEYMPSPEFSSPTAEREILGDEFLSSCAPEAAPRSAKRMALPPHLASLCEEQLLTPDQERQLFRRMNYLRYRADRLVEGHTTDTIDQWDVERAQGLLRAANWYRDHIVRSNVRLVISVVKKFANPQCSFDDLLSDGIMALIRAVDKFDYHLGFRFSTYATQVVRRNSYRFVMDRQEERFRVSNSLGEPGMDIAEETGESSMSEQRWHSLRTHLHDLMQHLDRRERFIIRARFSLGGHRRVQTLQKLADRLRISKERVRQLEKRAMEKLAALAAENPVEFLNVEQ